MAGKCEICGKIPMFGSRISHSHRVTNRMFMPNIHKLNMTVEGARKRVNVCTRCLRTAHKPAR